MTILVFSGTDGYRHDSIPAGIAAIHDLIEAVATEDPAIFDDDLARYAAVVFLNTSGTLFDDHQRVVFERYLRAGGGFVGVHCAAATEPDWPFYQELIGARFVGHPDVQPARVVVNDAAHPATRGLPAVWPRVDEWYNFAALPQRSRILLSVDEDSFHGGTMGARHPVAWCHERVGGRVCYTALGHTSDAYGEPLVRQHLRGAIRWASGH